MPLAGGLGRRLAGSLVEEVSADGPEAAVVGAGTGVVEMASVLGITEGPEGADEAGVATLEATFDGSPSLASE